MQAIKRLLLQSKPIYINFLVASGILISLGAVIAVDKSGIALVFSFCLCLFFILQVNYLITQCFPMSLAMGEMRKKSFQRILLFSVMVTLLISIFISLILILPSFSIFGRSIIPYLMGYNWNIIGNMPSKFITLMLIFSTLSGLIMWFTSGFRVGGFFNSFARILIALVSYFGVFSLFSDYIMWGTHSMFVHLTLLLASLLTHYLSYRTLLGYELQYGSTKKSHKKYILFIVILIIFVFLVNSIFFPQFKGGIDNSHSSTSIGSGNTSPSERQITVDEPSLMKFKIASVTGRSYLKITLISDQTGEELLNLSEKDLAYSTFKNLEPGNYTLLIQSSTNTTKDLAYSYYLQVSNSHQK